MIVVLALGFLVGCNEEEQTTNSGINVRIIEDFDLHDFDIPPHFQNSFCWEWGVFSQVFNGITGELENIIEFSDYHRLGNWCFPQPYQDYYILYVDLFDTQETDLAQQIAAEYFIFDQDFNLIEKFTITVLSDTWMRVGAPLPETIGQNEVGEWIGYTVFWDGEIFTYNFHTHEIVQIAHLNDFSFLWNVFLMPDVNKLAFMLADDFGFNEPARVEFGFMDLDTYEITMVHEAENMMRPHQLFPFQPIAPRGEVWLHDLSEFDAQEREVLTIDPLTGEVRTFLMREDDFTWRGDESYSRWISDVSITRDGRWLLVQAFEGSEELAEGWCGSNTTSMIRLYDVQTGEAIFEHLLIDEDTLNLGEAISSDASIIQLEENIYLIRQSIGTGWTEESFEPTGMRFEYIVIEIVVNEDE